MKNANETIFLETGVRSDLGVGFDTDIDALNAAHMRAETI